MTDREQEALSDDALLEAYRIANERAMHEANLRDGFGSNMSRESIVAGLRAVAALAAHRPTEPGGVDALANDIRSVDGKHDLGAGALAEALIAKGWHRPTEPDGACADPDCSMTMRHGHDHEPDEDVREALMQVLNDSDPEGGTIYRDLSWWGTQADALRARFHVTPRGEQP